jgi:hypothetical protein
MCHLGSFVLMHTLHFLSLYNLHYCSILQRSSVCTCCSFILSYIVCIAERRPALIGYLTHIFRLPDHLLRVKPHKDPNSYTRLFCFCVYRVVALHFFQFLRRLRRNAELSLNCSSLISDQQASGRRRAMTRPAKSFNAIAYSTRMHSGSTDLKKAVRGLMLPQLTGWDVC